METSKTVTVQVETVGQAYLEVLRARGIKYFFGNSGTDFGPIIDALAKFGAEKKMHPMPITVPHEFVAVSMAQGYAMITGEPQVVMVHVIVGTGNASAAVMNASRETRTSSSVIASALSFSSADGALGFFIDRKPP